MKPLRTCAILAGAILSGAIPICHNLAAQVPNDGPDKAVEQTRIAFSHALPRLDGGHLNITVLEVTYGPGESSPPHSHPCVVVGYVIKGALRTRIKGEAEVIYKAGESFYEAPNRVHLIAANASAKTPVEFLAYFVCDHDTPLSVAPSATPDSGDK
jgi:quercetin dioxygenase-like cupin family protein